MIEPARTVNCPACGKAVEWLAANKFRPFCSERCKKIDMGAWAAETYRVAEAEPTENDVDLSSDQR